MKKKLLQMLCIFCSFLVGLGLCGCKDIDMPGKGSYRWWPLKDFGSHLVAVYSQVDTIEISHFPEGYSRRVYLHLFGSSAMFWEDGLSEGLINTFKPWRYPKQEQVIRFAEDLGDQTFTQKLIPEYKEIDRMPGTKQLLAEDVIAIELMSLADYDDAHHAGSLLNDIVFLEYLCYEKFINQGYVWNENSFGNGPSPITDTYWMECFQSSYGKNADNVPYALSHVRLDGIAGNPLGLISVDRCPPSLTFPTLPSKPGTYPMRLTMTLKYHFDDYPEHKISVDFDLVVK